MRCKEQGQDETWPRPADGATPNTTLQAGPLTFEMVTLLLPIIAQNLLAGKVEGREAPVKEQCYFDGW